jgi:acetyltransferase-like isoleucine patch superfamily enzyme
MSITEFQQNFIDHYNQPRTLHPLLGNPGYTMPSLEGLSWHAMPGQGANNWILADTADLPYAYDVGNSCNNNVLVYRKGAQCTGKIYIRGSNNIAILSSSDLGHHPVSICFHNSNHLFFFGDGSTSNTVTFELGSDGTSIIVGEDCMFSAFVSVINDDSHGIIDLATGEHINRGADIVFEPHVWVGMNATILKGVKVGYGAVIAAGATVTQDVSRNTIVAGSPAREVKTGIGWVRPRYPDKNSLQFLAMLERRFAIRR